MNELEYKDTASGIFLSSVHRARDSTGHRPQINYVSSALMRAVVEEYGLEMKTYYLAGLKVKHPVGHGELCGYPVKVVESPIIFAVSISVEP